ncbi:FkbM family methyltransferase [Leptolyngbya sp. FACHB-17]|uniref:FkbM family methyltransferase n=1 Tax=unclassified Leptolyngbya TaxID=2650499 RepID=UPI0016803554|nr:FkbM family methyltransferase [Leptolyngbya sp. FACHB-17]MBD2082442.1 FkbM family methyltransferase [Leptolyngbya sp. FACHB-17]
MVQQVFSLCERYSQYLEHHAIVLQPKIRQSIQQGLEGTEAEQPQSALERNNVAIAALIEAEQCDPPFRGVLLDTAIELLSPVIQEHPLCAAHFALIQCLVGNTSEAINLAFSTFIQTLEADSFAMGAVYLPERSLLETVLRADTGKMQALCLLSVVLQQSQLVFYNSPGLRFLNLSTQVLPPNRSTALKLGVASFINFRWEGLAALYQAKQLDPTHPQVLQALFLAYRELRQPKSATRWLEIAQTLRSDKMNAWRWVDTSIDNDITYLPFENSVLAVEASFRSIVTSVLIAEGDWFEKEMEFWRSQIQAGMTVIDVGANVGVYTFSAADRVGKTGCVIAVEPFSGCVRCLEETRRINDFSQVRICAGAASDRVGTAKLSLQSASELNEVIEAESDTENAEVIKCFTLDSLIETEQINRVDFLKIDAEGHEMQVLKGSDRILSEFRPTILYENIAGSKTTNLPVAEYLIAKNYRLFWYQPFVQELVAVETLDDLQGNLNVIALPH